MLNRLSAWFGTRPKTMESQDVKLPPDLPNWPIVKELLQDIQGQLISENISEQETGWFMQTIYNTIQSDRHSSGTNQGHVNRLRQQIQSHVKKTLDHDCLWFGMVKYLRKVSKDKKEKFLYSTLPNIIEFALGIEECRLKEPLIKSRQQHGGSTKLSRQFVCSIVACFFLCLFPERKRESSNMNIVNFTAFFKHLPSPAQIAKLQCVLCYFDCVAERGMEIPGNIVFCRKVASLNWMLTFDELVHCDLKLCPLQVHPEGTIADSGTGTIQVCFGNKSVGGGVLGRSTVQEEILFSTCPELMAAMLFMENMDTNEAILVSGFEQFSIYSGYGDSLEFAGCYDGPCQIHTMVTIDATSYRETSVNKQYEESSILRDMNKAITGFSWMPGTDGGAVHSWEVINGEGEASGAFDVAADIVISAMTDALHQAAESPVDSQQSSCQHHHQLHGLSYQQCHLQKEYVSDQSSGHQQAAHILPQLSFATAESLHLGQISSDSAVSSTVTLPVTQTSDSTVSCSGTLQNTQRNLNSPSPNINFSVDSSPLLTVHSMAESATTVTNSSAQTLVQDLHSSNLQKYWQLEQSTLSEQEKCQELLIDSSSTSKSYRTCPNEDNVETTAKCNSLNKDALIAQSRLDHAGKLSNDILGNFSRIHTSRTGMPTSGHLFQETDEHCTIVHFCGLHGSSEFSEEQQKHSCPSGSNTVRDVEFSVTVKDSTDGIVSYPSQAQMGNSKFDEPALLQSCETLTQDKCKDIVNSLDVVLSLPAFHSELERVNSGLSNSSLAVIVDSQSLTVSSVQEEIRQPAPEVLYVSVENSELPLDGWRCSREKIMCDAAVSSSDSVLLEIPFSSSPQSSVSSTNVSPNTSFFLPESFHLEPPNGSSDVHVTADFFLPSLDSLNNQAQQFSRRGSRDFYGELRDFLNSSSSGSRSSGSGGPISTTNSSWGSRSGSISSHGTNGSTIDFPDFWSHFRRRSSQLSDTMSRRSSSSKHSSDFSTDLEEISEGAHKHDHGVIEEEGNFLSLVADFVSQYVSAAVSNGLAVGAHLSSGKHEDEMSRSRVGASGLKFSQFEQLNAAVEVINGFHPESLIGETVPVKTDTPVIILSRQEENLAPEASPTLDYRQISLSSLVQQSSTSEEKSEYMFQPDFFPTVTSSESSPVSKQASISKPARNLPVTSQPHELVTSLGDRHYRGHPSSRHSLDSGFSSAISSATFISKHTKVESGNEEASASSSVISSVTTLGGSCSLTNDVSTQALPLHTISQVLTTGLVPNTSALKRISLKNDIPRSAAIKHNIPYSAANDTTQYATLESKVIFLGSEDFPKSSYVLGKDNPAEKIQPGSAICEMNAAFIPVHPVNHEKKESCEVMDDVKPELYVSTKSKLPKHLSTDTYEGRGQEHKFKRKNKTEDRTIRHLETLSTQKHHMVSNSSKFSEVTSNHSQQIIPPSISGTITPCKSSGIPKFVDYVKKLPGYSVLSGSKMELSPKNITLSVKDSQRASEEKIERNNISSVQRSTRRVTSLLKLRRSRYVFSDVAAPLCGKQEKSKTATSKVVISKQNEKRSLKKQDEKKRKLKGNSSRQDQLRFTRSLKFIRFVNSIAEMSVSQAVLEGAETLAQGSGGRGVISDELYNWFATKIVDEVFLYVINELDMQQSGKVADISQAQDGALCDDFVSEDQQSLISSQREKCRAQTAVPKPKSILPTRSDTEAACSKGSGSVKVVKFKDSHGEEASSLDLSLLQSHVTTSRTSCTPTFQRQSSSIPVPIRWRSSLDLPSSSPRGVHVITLPSSKSPLNSTSAPQSHVLHHPGLTSKNMSIDIYQAAAAIVNQVFQTVSDSMDTQTQSPVSSGNRIHSSYDSITSNMFSNSSVQASDGPSRALRSVSPSIGVFFRKPMSRETLTNAFLKVDNRPSIKSYERRSSEPCQTSVQLSLQAFNSIKFSKQAVEDKQRKISRTDDDIGRGKTWRRGSLDGFSFERRNSCGFKDPVLSRFAEELMKADTSVPELVIVGSHPGSSSTGSRRSSICGYKESGQANLESELLNASFTSVCSVPMSHSPRSQSRSAYMDRSRSRESRNWKSDSSDTEYWFPPPKIVGDEFQQEYNRQHSQEELQDYASFFAGRVVQEAVCVLRCDPAYMSREEQDVELFAENLMDQIMRDALITSIRGDGAHRLCREGGDSSQRQSSLAGPMLTNDSGDAQHRLYYVEGARPKTSLWTRSKPKTIPQRRDIRSRQYEQRTSGMSRHEGGYRKRRATVASDREKLTSPYQHCLYASSCPSVTGLESSSQNFFHQGAQKNTADLRPSPSRLKRHSSPGSSLLPILSSSTKVSSTIQSQCQPQPGDNRALRKQVSGESRWGSHVHESSQLRREESCPSSATLCHSKQSGSPLPSSSASEGIEATGQEKKQKTKKVKASDKVKSPKLPYTCSQLARKKDYYSKTTDLVRQSNKNRTLHSSLSMEQCPVIDMFATTLSCAVLENALLHVQDNRWLRFLSYKRTIATGNWGCGAYRGNAQLKFVIQWLAASVGQAPLLVYYTLGDRRLEQAEQVANLISGWTVGHLAVALRDYCNWMHLNLASLPLSSFFSSSSRPQLHHQQTRRLHHRWQDEVDSRLPQTLFDFLLDKFQVQSDR